MKKRRANFIREWRKNRGLSQERLAARIDRSQGTLARIERGEIAYTQPILEAIADALSCQPAHLIMRPPGTETELETIIGGLSPKAMEYALIALRAIRETDKAA